MKHMRYKLGFTLYWLLFAVLAIFAAQNPGYVIHPERAPFPWLYLFITFGILAIFVIAYYFILKPAGGSSFVRVAIALILSIAMLTACVLTLYTDMDGLYYMPFYFSLLTFLVLFVMFIVRAGRILWHRVRGTP